MRAREFLSRLLRLLLTSKPSREKRLLTIGLAVLMAILLWVVVTLNQPYQHVLAFPLKVVNVPDSLQLQSVGSDQLAIELSGLGVDLLVESMRFRRDTMFLDFSELDRQPGYLTAAYRDNLADKIEKRFGDRLRVEKILTERIPLRSATKVRREVPVAFRAQVQLEPTMQLEDLPTPLEDMITLYGPQSWIDTVREWPTAPGYVMRVEAARTYAVPLAKPPPGCTVRPLAVRVKVSPQRYTETSVRVAVEVVGLPERTEVRLSHQEIEVACLVPFDTYEKVLEEARHRKVRIPFASLDPQVTALIPRLNLPEAVKPIARVPLTLSYVIIQK